MEDQNMPKADVFASIALVCFGVWIIVQSIKMPRYQEFGANPFSVPGIVPGILGTIITALSALVFIRAIQNGGYRLKLSRTVILNTVRDESFKRMMITCLVCAVYGLLMIGRISYYLATFLYVFAFLIIFQYRLSENIAVQRNLIFRSLVQALLVSAAVGSVFRYLFLVDLP